MTKNQKQPAPKKQKTNKEDKNSSGVMKIFYVFMLLLLLSGSLARFAGARRGPSNTSKAAVTPLPQSTPINVGGTAARMLTFHLEDGNPGDCQDLTVPAAGSAVYSNCGSGLEKQSALSDSEQAQLQTWIKEFQPIHYDHTGPTQQAGNETVQLYLNGQGSQQATALETQEILGFASSLAARIASQP